MRCCGAGWETRISRPVSRIWPPAAMTTTDAIPELFRMRPRSIFTASVFGVSIATSVAIYLCQWDLVAHTAVASSSPVSSRRPFTVARRLGRPILVAIWTVQPGRLNTNAKLFPSTDCPWVCGSPTLPTGKSRTWKAAWLSCDRRFGWHDQRHWESR